jgi:hypothetical protein
MLMLVEGAGSWHSGIERKAAMEKSETGQT